MTLCKVAKLQIANHESDEIKRGSAQCTEPLMKSGGTSTGHSTLLESSGSSLFQSRESMCDQLVPAAENETVNLYRCLLD